MSATREAIVALHCAGISNTVIAMAAKQKSIERGKVLPNQLKQGMAGETVWSDEKIFTVEQAHNHRNERIGRKISDIPYEQKTVYWRMKPASIMVWAVNLKNLEVPSYFC